MNLFKYRWFRIFLGLLLLGAWSSYFGQDFKAKNTSQVYLSQTFEHKQGWGYEIFHQQKRLIRQTFIPGITGEKGFISENQANKVAQLVCRKLNQRKKPSIQLTELDSLKIDYQMSQ